MKIRRFVTALAWIVLMATPAVSNADSPTVPNAEEQSLENLFNSIPAEPSAPTGSARETTAKGAAATLVGLSSWNLNGKQEVVYRVPLFRDPIDYLGLYLEPRIENIINLTATVGQLRVTSNWQINLWPLGTQLAGALPLAGSVTATVIPKDNFVSVGAGPLLFDAGYFVRIWGVADGLNPTDNINSVDYTQSLVPQAMPSLLFRLAFYPAPWTAIETIFEPYKQEDLFPVDPVSRIPQSLFSPSQVSVSNPPLSVSSSVIGARVAFYTPGVDFSVSYLYDIDQYYTPIVSYTSPLDKSLTLERLRIHRIGADARTTAGQFGLWIESCLSITTDPSMTDAAIRNPSIGLTAGGDVSYGPDGSFYLSLQYNGRYVFGFYDSFSTDYPLGQPDPLKLATDANYAIQFYDRALSQSLGDETEALLNTFALKADFPFDSGRWKPGVICTYLLPIGYDPSAGTRLGSLLLEPSLTYSPSSSVALSLGGQLIFAWTRPPGAGSVTLDTSDRLGMWHDQSNIYLKASYTW